MCFLFYLKKDMTKHGFIKQDTALESMRESDFDCYSAYGEVIDNSIQANATDIRITFSEKDDIKRKNAKKIDNVTFVDNGCGMDIEQLHTCLKLGHSTRYDDRDGIGRFGVGMTLGGIHECRKIEVYSKQDKKNWSYTYLDLDEIKTGKLEYIPEPSQKDPDKSIVDFITDSGTVVVWSKYDRQIDPYEHIIKELNIWVGRTFRRFIWGSAKGYDEVSIKVNNKIVNAIDPLFHIKDKTGYESETPAELLVENNLAWTIPVDLKSKKQKSDIKINMSYLPAEYRRERGKGADAFAKERTFDRNEGVSIMRNDREVFYGKIPHTGMKADERDRFIGIEINFDAALDYWFAVKNIKRGAVPIRELKKELINLIRPTVKTYREKISEYWDLVKREKEGDTNTQNSNIGISGVHSSTNTILKQSKDKLLRGNLNKSNDNDESIALKIKKDGDVDKIINGLKENGITIDERQFIGSDFIDIEHGNKLKTILYNTNSHFHKEYTNILNDLKRDNLEMAEKYKVLIDFIFVGYLLAESKIDPNETIDAKTTMDLLKQHWNMEMVKMMKLWK
jgi:hypothetical protein